MTCWKSLCDYQVIFDNTYTDGITLEIHCYNDQEKIVEKLPINISKHAKIAKLRQLLEELNSDISLLIFKGKLLSEDLSSLAQENIIHNSIIDLVPRGVGGNSLLFYSQIKEA